MKPKLLLALGVLLILAGGVLGAVTVHGMRAAKTATAGGCGCGCGGEGDKSRATEAKAGAGSHSCADSCSGEKTGSSGCAAPESAAAGTLDGDPLKNCGVLSLNEVCRAVGVKTSPEELVKLAHADEKSVTMLGLAEAARAKGLKATGMKLTYDDLRKSPKPLIAWLHEGHFVAVRDVTPQAVKVYDNVQGETSLPRAEFEKRWAGEVLLIEKGDRK